MGLFKKDKPTLAESLMEEAKALKEQNKAVVQKAKEERWAQQDKLDHEKEMRKMELEAQEKKREIEANTQKAEEFKSLGNEGTIDAYKKLYAAHGNEQKRDLQNRMTVKASLTGKKEGLDNYEDVSLALDSFPFDKDPVEFRKIWIFLKHEASEAKSIDTAALEFIVKQMDKMRTAAEMNFDKPDYANLLPDMTQTISEVKKKINGNQKKGLIIALSMFAGMSLLILLLYKCH